MTKLLATLIVSTLAFWTSVASAHRLVRTSMSTIDVILRLFLAAVLGAAIGLEREYRQKPAGLRTYR